MAAFKSMTNQILADAMGVQRVAFDSAASVDRECRLPSEAIECAREAGLLALPVLEEFGGPGGTIRECCEALGVISAGCTSAGLNIAMHYQQLSAIQAFAGPELQEELRGIVASGGMVASVTSDHVTGGDLFRSEAGIKVDNDAVEIDRAAPWVSYGESCSGFLVLMRESDQANPSQTRFVYCPNAEGVASVEGPWAAMGMRGTRSVAMNVRARVPAAYVLQAPGRDVVLQRLMPVGIATWAAVWVGAAKGALERSVAHLREMAALDPGSPAMRRIAAACARLECLEMIVVSFADAVDELIGNGSADPVFGSPEFQLRANSVKVEVARGAVQASECLLEAMGTRDGYQDASGLGIERVCRDLRSAVLMHSNDRILGAIAGTLAMRAYRGGDNDSQP